MTNNTKSKNKDKLKKVSGVTLSITKQVLVGLFELSKDLANVVVDPYGSYNIYSGIKPKYYYDYHKLDKKQVYQAVNNLKRQDLIRSYNKEGQTIYELTEAGKREGEKQLILQRLQSKKIDGKWRVVIFDIPEEKHRLRDNFRNLLKELEFKMLQASVWASPYDIFDELEILVPDIKQHSWIKLLLVDVIVGERDFKKLFK